MCFSIDKFEFLPEILPVSFLGILILVVLYAIGSGLIEVLVSPALVGSLFEKAGGKEFP